METGGSHPAGSSRALRLDPFALPVRFKAEDAGADGRVRQVELDRERVVLHRAVRGMRMKLRLPVAAFRGISLCLLPSNDGDMPAMAIILDHDDKALAVPLHLAAPGEDIDLISRAWSRVLNVPLLTADNDQPQPDSNTVQIGEDTGRRRRRSSIKTRRPSILMRRKPGRGIADASVHRGEHEIIARN